MRAIAARCVGCLGLIVFAPWVVVAEQLALCPLLAQADRDYHSTPLLLRLDPQTRLRVFLALGSIVFLGVLAICLIRLAGKLVRLYADGSRYHSPWSVPPGSRDDWADKSLYDEGPLSPRNDERGPEGDLPGPGPTGE
jgi:hypothetical protein